MDMRILELAAEITKQALATEKNGWGLHEEVVEFLDRTARKLAELEQTPLSKSDFPSNGALPNPVYHDEFA